MKDVLFVFDAEDASRAAVVLRRAATFCRARAVELSTSTDAHPASAAKQIEGAMRDGTPAVFLIGPRRVIRAVHALAMAQGSSLGAPSMVVDISRIKTLKPDLASRPLEVPQGVAFYFWLKDDGYANFGKWIQSLSRANATAIATSICRGGLSKGAPASAALIALSSSIG